MGLFFHDLDLTGFETQPAIAVGVSGGPDSLALAWLLKEWAAVKNIALHVLTVDHGLRAQSAAEAQAVGDLVSRWPGAVHATLRWEEDKPGTRVLEQARTARYRLMRDYCLARDIGFLFLAHHQDDQAETFLLRLAGGSGVDGLAAMQPLQSLAGIMLARPLLHVPKAALVALCDEQGLAYARDPTNENEDYARPRLRAARAILEEEGLSASRLATTAMRMARARRALEEIAEKEYARLVRVQDEESLSLDATGLRDLSEEIIVRLLATAMAMVSALDSGYPPRLEKIERLAQEIKDGRLTKPATLGGCLFVPDAKNGLFWVKRESV